MEDYLQTEWTHLDVTLTSVTEHWAATVVTGPNARKLLESIVKNCDLNNAAFPHLAWRDGMIGDIGVRLYRISFTGELSFEVHCDARFGQQVWDAIWSAGQRFEATPYGTENMHVLRAEKGYIIIGQETDGTIGPDDLGLSWAIATKKPDFIGKRSLARAIMSCTDRKQLVGLLPDDTIPEGAQIVATQGDTKMLGYVTSSYWSPTLVRPIALALVSAGRERMGQTIQVRFGGKTVSAQIADPVFYDKDGSRMNG
jgi:sarcosine oxidase, subunit alpha